MTNSSLKHEWRKHEKQFYLPKAKPEVVELPKFNFVTISGTGNPNNPEFGEYIGALYAVSYAIKMNLKKFKTPPEGYKDYTVYPLEGIWDISEEAKKNYNGKLDKDQLVFKIMIRQPNFVNEAIFDDMLSLAKKKKPNPFLNLVQFEPIADGRCIQMLHIGSFDSEPISFAIMEEFAKNEQLTRIEKTHREIYLSDFRKVPNEKLKTVLRFKID